MEYYTDSMVIREVAQHSDKDNLHGTFCLGIAAGTPVQGKKSSYSGVAIDADLAVRDAGRFMYTCVEYVYDLFRYADSVEKPIVVNLSLGVIHLYHAGDGESLVDLAMDELINENPKGRIVVASAGNEGRSNLHSKIELQENDSLRGRLSSDGFISLSI